MVEKRTIKEPPRIGGVVCLIMVPYLNGIEIFGLFSLMLLGILDDAVDIRPLPKLIVEGLVCYFVTSEIFATIWIVFFINALNLSDNMDGLAIGLGIIGSLALGLYPLAVMLFLLLPLNVSPARVYLGDFGSLSLGYILGLHALEQANVWPVMIPVVDTLYVAIRRPLVLNRSPWKGGRDHLSHLLTKYLGTRGRAVWVLCLLGSILALIG